jgi:hypothetical protein
METPLARKAGEESYMSIAAVAIMDSLKIFD